MADDLYPVIKDNEFRGDGYFEGYCLTKNHEEVYQEKVRGHMKTIDTF